MTLARTYIRQQPHKHIYSNSRVYHGLLAHEPKHIHNPYRPFQTSEPATAHDLPVSQSANFWSMVRQQSATGVRCSVTFIGALDTVLRDTRLIGAADLWPPNPQSWPCPVDHLCQIAGLFVYKICSEVW